jgi:hypothetical protein
LGRVFVYYVIVRGLEFNFSFESESLIGFSSGAFLLAFLLSAKQRSKNRRTVRRPGQKHPLRVPMKQTIIRRPRDINFRRIKKEETSEI